MQLIETLNLQQILKCKRGSVSPRATKLNFLESNLDMLCKNHPAVFTISPLWLFNYFLRYSSKLKMLLTSLCSMNKNSQFNYINRVGLTIEPYGTPLKISSGTLWELNLFSSCFFFLLINLTLSLNFELCHCMFLTNRSKQICHFCQDLIINTHYFIKIRFSAFCCENIHGIRLFQNNGRILIVG